MQRILRFLNIIAIILLGESWLALRGSVIGLSGEFGIITITYLVILLILIINVILLSFKNTKKQKQEE